MSFCIRRKKLFCWLALIFCLVGGYYLWKGEGGRVNAPPWVLEVTPGPSGCAELYPAVKVAINDKGENYFIKLFRQRDGVTPVTLAPVPGVQEVSAGQLIFRPVQVLIPNSTYMVMLGSKKDKNRVFSYRFKTVDMQDRLWMAVKLGRVHTAVIYKGREPVKWMPASGGRTGHETPLGIFYAGDRGNRFWSARYGEGALSWIRLKGNYLIHSVPRSEGWQIKTEEHNKLGLPASHGCVRLSDNDARWVYDNLPQGALVVIHP